MSSETPNPPEPRFRVPSLSRELYITLAVVALFMTLASALCFFVKPIREAGNDVLAAVIGSKKTEAVEVRWKGGSSTGVYSLGKMQMSLGGHDQFVDSEIELEYDGAKLYDYSNGQVQDRSCADSFLRRMEGKIRDGIVNGASNLKAREVGVRNGYHEIKERLRVALNENFGHEDVFVDLYFKRFVVYDGEIDQGQDQGLL